MSIYGTSVVKRLSKTQARELDHHLLAVAEQEKPTSVRGMCYMAMGAGLIDKDTQGKRNNYMRIQRRLLQMRRDGTMPYSWITDGSHTIYGYNRFADEAEKYYRKEHENNVDKIDQEIEAAGGWLQERKAAPPDEGQEGRPDQQGPTEGHRRKMGMSANLAEHYALPTSQQVEDEITEQRSIVTTHVQSGVS